MNKLNIEVGSYVEPYFCNSGTGYEVIKVDKEKELVTYIDKDNLEVTEPFSLIDYVYPF